MSDINRDTNLDLNTHLAFSDIQFLEFTDSDQNSALNQMIGYINSQSSTSKRVWNIQGFTNYDGITPYFTYLLIYTNE